MRYGKHSRHGIDVYEPRRVAKPISTVIFFYGGGWTAGSKQDYRFVGAALVRQGFRVCIPDYRLHPEASLEEIQLDGRDAFKSIANRYSGGDIFLMGHSAGAHIALSLAASVGLSAVAGVVAFSAPYVVDLEPGRRLPPGLFIAAKNDRIVPARISQRLASNWATQSKATHVALDKGGHALVVGALSPLLQWYLPVADTVSAFICLHSRER